MTLSSRCLVSWRGVGSLQNAKHPRDQNTRKRQLIWFDLILHTLLKDFTVNALLTCVHKSMTMVLPTTCRQKTVEAFVGYIHDAFTYIPKRLYCNVYTILYYTILYYTILYYTSKRTINISFTRSLCVYDANDPHHAQEPHTYYWEWALEKELDPTHKHITQLWCTQSNLASKS